MSDNKESAPSHFVPIENEADGFNFVREGVQSYAPAIAWTQSQTTHISSHLSSFDQNERTISLWVPTEQDLESSESSRYDLEELKARLKNGEEVLFFFSVSLTKANIFFKSKLKTVYATELVFDYPEKMFRVQRRKDFRLPIPDGYVLYVFFNDPILNSRQLKKKVLDISAGGLSFISDFGDDAIYRPGEKLKGFGFRIRSKNIECEAEVRHSRSLTANVNSKISGVKVGIQFNAIKSTDSRLIGQYVFEESRKYFSKFL